ncbi:CRISPR-associated protein Csx14 [Methanomicrobium sp. W14]|uniref:CRISPR-associated protein Csx14 n=1 Tax=Methanomicrobium sp. W14 TaxID=2817839 RepID=UPI001AE202B3|nr:CRISPR-associated protein Csx14 [Methanomicrobium sp. W14]MBP2132409.1 CRISPR-associated protein Csx14 [Methanomicrobium sp. W14]
MKTAVIAPLGLSPPAITSFIDGIGAPVSDLVIIATDNNMVLAGADFLSAGLSSKYPWLRIHTEVLSFDDISNNEENFTFMSLAAHNIRREREDFNCDRIFLNCAGGRKNECVTLALLGQILQVDGVFHIVNKNVSVLNERLEYLRKDILEFFGLNEEARDRLYEKKKSEYDALLFPLRSGYEIIRIPTLPFPDDYLVYLIHSISNSGAGMEKSDLELMVSHGIFDKIGNNYEVTPHGQALLEVLIGK